MLARVVSQAAGMKLSFTVYEDAETRGYSKLACQDMMGLGAENLQAL